MDDGEELTELREFRVGRVIAVVYVVGDGEDTTDDDWRHAADAAIELGRLIVNQGDAQ